MKKEFDIEVSFCVPVYNVENYIEACIESIISQTKNVCDYEIVCVDDNSSDNSYSILCKLAKNNPNITVYKNEENKGISHTRNRLIDLSRGKYLWFVDSDDMLYSGAVQKLLKVAKSTDGDIILANYIKIAENDFEIERNQEEVCKFREISASDFDWLPDKNGECRMMSSCRGLISANYLKSNNIRYNPQVVFKEDALLYYQLLLKKPKWVKCEFLCYCVRQRRGSAMRGGFIKRAKERYFSNLSLADELSAIQCENKVISKAFLDVKKELLNTLMNINNISTVFSQYKVIKSRGYIENGSSLNKGSVFIARYILKRILRTCKALIFSILRLFK